MIDNIYKFKIVDIEKTNINQYAGYIENVHCDVNIPDNFICAYSNSIYNLIKHTYLDFIEVFNINSKTEYNNDLKFEQNSNKLIHLKCSTKFRNMNNFDLNQIIYARVVNSFNLDSVTLIIKSEELFRKINQEHGDISSQLMMLIINSKFCFVKEKHNLSLINYSDDIFIEQCSPLKQGLISLKTEIILIKEFENKEKYSNDQCITDKNLSHFIIKDRQSLNNTVDHTMYSIPCSIIHDINTLISNYNGDQIVDQYNCIFINKFTSLQLNLACNNILEIIDSKGFSRTIIVCVFDNVKLNKNYTFYVSSHLYFNSGMKNSSLRFRVSQFISIEIKIVKCYVLLAIILSIKIYVIFL